MNKAFWKGKKVLITGHTGFKGTWISLWLNKLGAKVYGYALDPMTNPSMFNILDMPSIIDHQIGDVCDLEKFKSRINDIKPDIIIHMAAQPLVRYSYEYPVETYKTNVMGTVNLLEAVRNSPSVKAVVNVTTDKCYENKEWVWGYREDEPMGGFDPYSNSKGCSELLTSAFRNSYFNPVEVEKHGKAIATARAGNVIGGGDWALDRLIPDIIESFSERKLVNIRNPKAIRPWQHVLEPLSGYLMLAENLWNNPTDFASAWNFGPNDDDVKSVEYIVDYLAQSWGDNCQWKIDGFKHPHEAGLLKLDISKAKTYLNWRPNWYLEKTIDSIVEWHKSYLNKEDMITVTLKQIEEFENINILI